MDAQKNLLYISDTFNQVIRVFNLESKETSTLCGTPSIQGSSNGIGTDATFNFPKHLAFDSTNRILFVADNGNHVVRKVYVDEGRVETLSGNLGDGIQ